jgi:lysozyme
MKSQFEVTQFDVRRKATEIAATLCRRFEGLVLKPYLCSAGVPTIGYGATYYLDGRPVTLKDPPISREAAERMLILQIERDFLPAVVRLCPVLLHETPERLAAIIDFAFNCGHGALRASTLRRKINAELWNEVPVQLMRWNRAGGRVLRGLTIRRQAEANLI